MAPFSAAHMLFQAPFFDRLPAELEGRSHRVLHLPHEILQAREQSGRRQAPASEMLDQALEEVGEAGVVLLVLPRVGSYQCRWKSVSPEPFESMMVLIGVPLLERAMTEVFGPKAPAARLRDLSAFTDPVLESWTQRLREELGRRKASPLFVQGIAQAIVIHLARNYSETIGGPRSASPSLPGYKLKQVLDWMAEHLADEFSLDDLAAKVGLSKFYFDRLFKAATGVSPSRYHTALRMDEAKRLLRESGSSVIDVAMEVGYANPSHFAQVFRRETGLPPSNYRRRR